MPPCGIFGNATKVGSLKRKQDARTRYNLDKRPGDERTDLRRSGEFRIQLLRAFGANPMGKLGVGMVADILFNLLPISVVVANLFTGSTNRQQSSQGFNVG